MWPSGGEAQGVWVGVSGALVGEVVDEGAGVGAAVADGTGVGVGTGGGAAVDIAAGLDVKKMQASEAVRRRAADSVIDHLRLLGSASMPSYGLSAKSDRYRKLFFSSSAATLSSSLNKSFRISPMGSCLETTMP